MYALCYKQACACEKTFRVWFLEIISEVSSGVWFIDIVAKKVHLRMGSLAAVFSLC